MKVDTEVGPVSVAHLIPSSGRAELMMKNMSKMRKVWDRPGTFIAIDRRELKAYRPVIQTLDRVEWITYDNPDRVIGRALEVLRKTGTDRGYDYYVLSDDNCVFTRESFTNLVRATAEYGKPVHMAGSHPTAKHFDAKRIRLDSEVKHGLTTYRKMTWIFRCIPFEVYRRFRYPDLPCYSDRYFSMWMISKGYFHFRCVLEAPFSKKRFAQGGIGEKHERSRSAIGLSMMARDFAKTFGALEVRIPWEEIIKLNKARRRKIRLTR